MTNEKQLIHISKFLSLVLRHQPETIGIELDQNGWTDTNELIVKANDYGIKVDRELLSHIVETNSKKRFALETGLEKRSRQHVHLSSEIETAVKVGQRYGKPFVLEVLAGSMFKDNFEFFISENGVWLTDHVPAKYLQLTKE